MNKYPIILRQILLCLRVAALSAAAAGTCACAGGEIRNLTERLDRVLENKKVYEQEKEKQIDELRRMLTIGNITPQQEYDINYRLYDKYRKYRLDSAIVRIERNLQIARLSENPDEIIRTKLHLAQLYSFAGMSLEAKSILESLDQRTLPRHLLNLYYETRCKFCQHYATMSGQSRYLTEMSLYRDSLLTVSDPASTEYKLNKVYALLERGETAIPEKMLAGMLENEPQNTPVYAEIAYTAGRLYRKKGDRVAEKKYYILSATADALNAIKENASFHSLANMYYEEGNLTRANKYAQAAIEDARFSNLQYRTTQMSGFYSTVNASYQSGEAKTKAGLQKYLVSISILSAILVLSFIFVYKQNRKLHRIRGELSRVNSLLVRLNDEMSEKNEMLSDSNNIKEQYIAHFFNLCSLYIDKMEGNRRSLLKIAQNRQFDELNKRLRSTSMLHDELEELYENFDAVFLNLYPTFVDDFNALLIEDEQIALRSGDLLNKELRIYALLRLGITDSVKIASFLRCSLSTVYNYRSKVRGKAAVSREEFEKMVMKIGVVHKNRD